MADSGEGKHGGKEEEGPGRRVAEPLAPYGSPVPGRRTASARARSTRSTERDPDDRGFRIAERCEFARRAFGSDAELARLLGVDRSRISRWRQGDLPDPANADRVVGIDAVVELLSGFLDERSIPKWLYGVNTHLNDRRPVDVLVSGRLSEVIAAIEAEKSGAFG